MMDYPAQFLSAGIGIIPVRYMDKRPDAAMLPRDATGKPTWEPYKHTLPSKTDVSRWFTQPENYGVVAGWLGLLLLDFDDSSEYTRWRVWASRSGGIAKMAAENAFQVQTARGVHVYLRSTMPGANRKIGKIDVKYHGYVLGPGSVHPSGTLYRALRSGFVFPSIGQLSDVLPGEILTQATIDNIKPVAAPTIDDPWIAAMTSRPALGTGVVAKIKGGLRIEDSFVQTRRTGDHWLMTACPFHEDAHPSFWVDTKKQICGCHAGCTPKPLDVIGLYARMYGISNSEAIRVLAGMV